MAKAQAKTAFPEAKRGSIFWLPPEDIGIPTDRSDPLFDPRGLEPPDEAMVAGIRTYGILQPITVIKAEDGQAVVVAGRRRVLACRQANKELKAAGLPPKLVPAVFRHEDGHEAVPLMIIENSHRLDESTLAKARKARAALTGGYAEPQVAEMFGVGEATLRSWLKLLELNPRVQAAVEKGTVRLTDAVKIIGKASREDQPAELARLELERPTRAARKASGTKGTRTVTPVARLKRLELWLDEAPGSLPSGMAVLLEWLRGGVDDKHLAVAIPDLAPMLTKRKAAR